MREDVERNFTAQLLSTRKAQRHSAEVTAEESVLKAFGGEPLAGSGFEDEEPDSES
jgi:hypothetical protein